MSYWNRPISISSPFLDSVSISNKKGRKSISDEFYEIEPAIVLDVILDKGHEILSKNSYTLNPDQWPVDINGNKPLKTDLDYTWVGRILVRLLYSQIGMEKEDLIWAMPLESNISEYPLVNELVGVVFYLGQYFYTRKINTFNTPNSNADFNLELQAGGFRVSSSDIVQGNREFINLPTDPRFPYKGPPTKLNYLGSVGYKGVLGRYFFYNNKIRCLRRREGDLIFESRFGQSIRFATYDDIRDNDKGYNSLFPGYSDYMGTGILNPSSSKETGGGNPMLLIRNRQRPIVNIDDEKNVGGYMLEDVNNDGSSIHLTSGVTLSAFQTTCYKTMWGDKSEEQSGFNGQTTFKYPQLNDDQIVINSNRIIISAKKNETFQYSKKRISIVTDSEYTLDANDQIVINTNNKTVINSPAIYLGEYNQTNEPVLLGQTTVNWLYELCDWLISHTHWYKHVHPDAQGGNVGQPDPLQTQSSVQIQSLVSLREQLNLLLSRRVFVVGGGFAPGKNGGTVKNGTPPVSISIPSGEGVPGGFYGVNYMNGGVISSIDGTGTNSPSAANGIPLDTLLPVDILSSMIDTLKNNVKTSKQIASVLPLIQTSQTPYENMLGVVQVNGVYRKVVGGSLFFLNSFQPSISSYGIPVINLSDSIKNVTYPGETNAIADADIQLNTIKTSTDITTQLAAQNKLSIDITTANNYNSQTSQNFLNLQSIYNQIQTVITEYMGRNQQFDDLGQVTTMQWDGKRRDLSYYYNTLGINPKTGKY